MRDVKYKVYIQDEGIYEVQNIDFYNKKITYLLTDNFDGGYLCAECDFKYATLLQYTGLKDKKGKEIYEGDICINVTADSKFGVVYFEDGMFIFRADNGDFIHHYISTISNNCVIIGNIYENPELLKGNKWNTKK